MSKLMATTSGIGVDTIPICRAARTALNGKKLNAILNVRRVTGNTKDTKLRNFNNYRTMNKQRYEIVFKDAKGLEKSVRMNASSVRDAIDQLTRSRTTATTITSIVTDAFDPDLKTWSKMAWSAKEIPPIRRISPTKETPLTQTEFGI